MGLVKIVDNFLPESDFNSMMEFFTQIKSGNRATYYVSQIMDPDSFTGQYDNLRFANTLFAGTPSHGDYNQVVPLLNKIAPRAIMRIKVNFDFRTPTPDPSGMHIDISGVNTDGITTGIFYLNTNNGKTKFKDGTIVDSVANRFVSFPGSMEHEGISCTDTPFRCVINLNYF